MDTSEDSLTLKVKSRIIVPDGEEIYLRFPACRISRNLSKACGNVKLLDRFHGRIQAAYLPIVVVLVQSSNKHASGSSPLAC